MIEKLTINLVIYFIKKGVGKPCPDEDELGLCLTCQAYKTIKFLEEWIELCKL
jgi:hypothetical protein